MPRNSVQKDSVGIIFRLTLKDEAGVVINITAASTKEIRFERPDGVAGPIKTAVFPSGDNGTQGRIEYSVIAGDLDTVGTWKYQGKVIIPTPNTYYTEVKEFQVEENVNAV